LGGIITAFASLITKWPIEIAKAIASNYLFFIFAGGLIFFFMNSDYNDIQKVFDAFLRGDIGGTLEAIVDASIKFASNVKENFNPATLGSKVSQMLCKIMSATGIKNCAVR
jgi:hypothetical protein